MTATSAPLPGSPPPVLARAWEGLSETHRAALRPHLLDGTPAPRVADWLRRAGVPVGTTSIKDYRRQLRQVGV